MLWRTSKSHNKKISSKWFLFVLKIKWSRFADENFDESSYSRFFAGAAFLFLIKDSNTLFKILVFQIGKSLLQSHDWKHCTDIWLNKDLKRPSVIYSKQKRPSNFQLLFLYFRLFNSTEENEQINCKGIDLGEVRLNLALGMVTSSSGWKTACCWYSHGPRELVTPVKATDGDGVFQSRVSTVRITHTTNCAVNTILNAPTYRLNSLGT